MKQMKNVKKDNGQILILILDSGELITIGKNRNTESG